MNVAHTAGMPDRPYLREIAEAHRLTVNAYREIAHPGANIDEQSRNWPRSPREFAIAGLQSARDALDRAAEVAPNRLTGELAGQAGQALWHSQRALEKGASAPLGEILRGVSLLDVAAQNAVKRAPVSIERQTIYFHADHPDAPDYLQRSGTVVGSRDGYWDLSTALLAAGDATAGDKPAAGIWNVAGRYYLRRLDDAARPGNNPVSLEQFADAVPRLDGHDRNLRVVVDGDLVLPNLQ